MRGESLSFSVKIFVPEHRKARTGGTMESDRHSSSSSSISTAVAAASSVAAAAVDVGLKKLDTTRCACLSLR